MRKGRFELRLDNELRAEMEVLAAATGRDLTAIIHDAVRKYKASRELQADIATHQKRVADAAARFTGPKATKMDTSRKTQDNASKKPKKGL